MAENTIEVGDIFYLKDGISRIPFRAEWLYSDGMAYVKQHEYPCGYGSVGIDEIGEIFVRGVTSNKLTSEARYGG